MIETIPLLIVFVVVMTFTMGAFGIIHTGILNSIAARNYAFETMRGRSNIVYWRDTIEDEGYSFYSKIGFRLHGIQSEATSGNNVSIGNFEAVERPMQIGFPNNIEGRTEERHLQIHNDVSVSTGRQNTKFSVNPVWVKIEYGICVNAKCGD